MPTPAQPNWPKITIVTPTFNRTEFLEETILSVLNQGYPNLEYIIVDGGSTNPELLALIRKYEDRLAWWISEKDRGHAEAIRKGFDRSDGEIMNWLCSDDTYLPGCLFTVAQAFLDNPRAEVVFGHHNGVDETGKLVSNGRVVRFHPLNVLAVGNIHQGSVFWKRSLYDRAGGNVGGREMEYAVYSPDSDLFLRFAKTTHRWIRINKTLSTFRRHEGQTTTRETQLVWDYYWKAAKENFPFWTSNWTIYSAVSLAMRLRRYALLLLQGDARFVYSKLRGRVLFE